MAKSFAKRKAMADAPELEKVPMKEKSKRIFNLLAKPKEEERKAYRPRGYRTRKFGTVVFWIMFSFIFLLIGFAALGVQRGSNAEEAPVAEAKLNMATTPTAVQYAENFAREYFSWQPGTEAFANREKRLAPYLAKGLDKHAGVQATTISSTSILLGSEVVNIEEKGENQAYITLRVDQKLGIPKEAEAKKPAAQPTKAAATKTENAKGAAAEKEAAKAPTAAEKKEIVYETKPSSKFFVVPVAYSSNYGVYDLPKFTYISPETTVEAPDKDNGLPEVESAEIKGNVRNFLDTFFDSYAQDPADKLAYLLEDPEHPNGLNKRMSFVSIKSSQIYQGDTPTNFIVFTDVLLEDPVSKDRFVTNYRLDVTQKDTRYVVSKIDHQ